MTAFVWFCWAETLVLNVLYCSLFKQTLTLSNISKGQFRQCIDSQCSKDILGKYLIQLSQVPSSIQSVRSGLFLSLIGTKGCGKEREEPEASQWLSMWTCAVGLWRTVKVKLCTLLSFSVSEGLWCSLSSLSEGYLPLLAKGGPGWTLARRFPLLLEAVQLLSPAFLDRSQIYCGCVRVPASKLDQAQLWALFWVNSRKVGVLELRASSRATSNSTCKQTSRKCLVCFL